MTADLAIFSGKIRHVETIADAGAIDTSAPEDATVDGARPGERLGRKATGTNAF